MKSKFDIKTSIHNLLLLLNEPFQHEKVNLILGEINEQIKSGAIMGIYKQPMVNKPKRRVKFFCICWDAESEDDEFDKAPELVTYYFLNDLLYKLAISDDYQTEFKSLLTHITFNQISKYDFFNFIGFVRAVNQRNLYDVVNKYFELDGSLKLVLSHFPSFWDNGCEDTIKLIMQHRDFEKIFDKVELNELLGHFETTDGFNRATQLFDFSQCDIPFSVIRESVIIEFFKKFPHRLLQMDKIKYYDDRINKNYWLNGNIYNYAANLNYNKLLIFLIAELKDNPSFSKEVSSRYIYSVETAILLYNEKFNISFPENNAYCLEALSRLNRNLSEFEITSEIINDSIEYKLYGLIHFILTSTHVIQITLEQLKSIFINFAYTSPDLISQTIFWLKKQNTNHQYDDFITDLFKLYLSHPGNEHVILLLLRHHSSLVYQLRNSYQLERNIMTIYDPKMIKILLEHKFYVPNQKLKEVYLTAVVRNDEDTMSELDKHLVNSDKLDLWKYSTIELPESNIISGDIAKYYGSGIHQEQYRYYQQLMVDNIVSHLLLGKFKLLPSGFTVADVTWLREDYEAPVPLEYFPLYNDVSKNVKMIFSLEEKYKDQLTLFSLGAFRHSISLASQPSEHDSYNFGGYRMAELMTPMPIYRSYFERFIKTEFKNYKNTKYIKLGEPSSTGLPHCSIMGYINNHPIELTKYVETEDGYAWVHTDVEHLPEILFHCQTIIDTIEHLDIDNQDVVQVNDLSEKIGHLHWWLSHACYFQRGSASVSESTCKGLFKKHGLRIAWKSMPDCEALISPSEDDYARRYFSLLTMIPLPLKKDVITQCGQCVHTRVLAHYL